MDSCGHGTKGAGPYFQRSMASEVLTRLIYRFCKLYIDNMLIHEATESEFLTIFRRIVSVLTSHGSKPEKAQLCPVHQLKTLIPVEHK